MDDRARLGRRGEKQAERYLRRLRYRIVCRNYRCRLGEIDLIALDGKTIVFVEVKTRSSEEHADVFDAIHPEKQRRLSRAAEFFLHQTNSHHRACRFDAVAVIVDGAGRPAVEHAVDAFEYGRTPRPHGIR